MIIKQDLQNEINTLENKVRKYSKLLKIAKDKMDSLKPKKETTNGTKKKHRKKTQDELGDSIETSWTTSCKL